MPSGPRRLGPHLRSQPWRWRNLDWDDFSVRRRQWWSLGGAQRVAATVAVTGSRTRTMVISGTLPLTTSSGRRRRRSRMIHLILEAPDQLPQPAVKAVEAIPVSGGCSPRHGEGA